MATFHFILLVAGILAAWAIASWAIWKRGSGEITWTVWCPVHKKTAKIVAVQREAQFAPSCASLQIYDVKRCSLFGGPPVTCGKECLQRP
jgi:hypothetical protein